MVAPGAGVNAQKQRRLMGMVQYFNLFDVRQRAVDFEPGAVMLPA
jgi:hypothetical protein